MIEITVRLFVTFYFTLKLGGIVSAFGMLFVALSYIFLTIPLNIIWFTKALFGLYCVLTVVVTILGPALKAPDEQMLSYGLKALFSIVNILFMSALALYFVISFMKKQQKLEELEVVRQKELNMAKTRLFTNITHEFRTPLTVITGMSDLIEREPGQWILEGTIRIRDNSSLMLRLVNQLLDISKIEVNAMPVHLVKADIATYVHLIIELHRSAAFEKGISMNFITPPDPVIMDFDPDIISKIVSNLLGNAIKFTHENGTIEVKINAEETEKKFFLQVADNGRGIPPDNIQHVFDRFYQAEDHATSGGGTGLGLALAKELAMLVNGNISVESEPGKGSVFTVYLPLARTAEPGEPYLKTFQSKSTVGSFPGKPAAGKRGIRARTSLPHLLIVEDSRDVSFYLSAILGNNYHTEFAWNGKEGLEKATEKIPDIIVSDIMMPEMDGIEMLDRLKTDFRTSHIPVVMLTAKADIASRLAGLERGADAYITKPFHEAELHIQLRSLIELRKKLHERYSSMNHIPESDDPDVKAEDRFMLKVRESLLKNLDNDAFTIFDLCRELAVSHAQLYRKFKSLSNLSIAGYMKLLRLNRAKELFSSSELNITQVAFEVGFKNLSHFSREFALHFGKSPREMRKAAHANLSRVAR